MGQADLALMHVQLGDIACLLRVAFAPIVATGITQELTWGVSEETNV